MTDYPNMSYCMCENTTAAVNQILTAIERQKRSGGTGSFLAELSSSEAAAFRGLVQACSYLLDTEAAQEFI